MKATEILAQLRQTFNELIKNAEVPQPVTTAPAIEAYLEDGSEVMITEMVVGGVVTKDGSPVPPGSYKMKDGITIVIGDNGVISEIVPAAAPAAPTAPTEAGTTPEMESKLSERFASFESEAKLKFSAYEQKFTEYEARLNKATKVIEGLLNLTQTLAETPTGIPDPVIKGGAFIAERNANRVDSSLDILFT